MLVIPESGSRDAAAHDLSQGQGGTGALMSTGCGHMANHVSTSICSSRFARGTRWGCPLIFGILPVEHLEWKPLSWASKGIDLGREVGLGLSGARRPEAQILRCRSGGHPGWILRSTGGFSGADTPRQQGPARVECAGWRTPTLERAIQTRGRAPPDRRG